MALQSPPAVDSSPALERALKFLREIVAPMANEIDASTDALRDVLAAAGDARILALKRPEEYGGPALDEAEFRLFQEEAARASGSFAFLQTQHQSAVSLISKWATPEFAGRTLPHMGNGELTMGVGFSQLRRPGAPMVRAIAEGGGYRVDGRVPWATGYTLFDRYLLGATLEDGRALFASLPFSEGDGQRIEGPMRLAAMESAATVAIDLDDVRVAPEYVAFIKEADWITNNDTINIALQSQFAFGCARAALDVMRAAIKPGKEFVGVAADALEAELKRCRAETYASVAERSIETAHERLVLRAWAIELAVRCAHAAVAASSGAANSMDHPAQRIYREALVYTVSAQTLPIMHATLDRLVGRIAPDV